ncbi:MAG: hypothetical protein K6G48_06490 [Acholeplasmatales bacterium]|nr:hypothetical protein [Acholeplasmatales bacterium]
MKEMNMINYKYEDYYFNYLYLDSLLEGQYFKNVIKDNYDNINLVGDIPSLILKVERVVEFKNDYRNLKNSYKAALDYDLDELKMLSTEDPTNLAYEAALDYRENNTPEDYLLSLALKKLIEYKRQEA